jgi:hypothetical protein
MINLYQHHKPPSQLPRKATDPNPGRIQRFYPKSAHRANVHNDRLRRRTRPHIRPSQRRIAIRLHWQSVRVNNKPPPPAHTLSLGPIAAVIPTQDHQSYLVTALDSHARLMDATTGKLLNDFEGHLNNSYRCRACFGSNEASVVCGDENGEIWAWDLLDVSSSAHFFYFY